MRKKLTTAVTVVAVLMVPLAAFAAGADKVTICHIPPGNPGNAHTITVGAPAVEKHVANHGDTVGACDNENQPPEAVAGEDVCLLFGEEAVLDGSESSDPEGADLTFEWNIAEAPDASSASIVDPTADVTSLPPDRLGDYKVELTVSDGELTDTDDLLVGATMIVTLDEEEYLVSVGDEIEVTVSLDEAAPPGGAEVQILFTPDDVEEGEDPAEAHATLADEPIDSILIPEGDTSVSFQIVSEAQGALDLTVTLGSEECNHTDTARVFVVGSLLEQIGIDLDQDLDAIAFDLRALLEAALVIDAEFESSRLWQDIADALADLDGFIDGAIDALLNF